VSALGFIGLGVMGEPMCRNLAAKSGRKVVARDLRPEPLERLKAHGVDAGDPAACDVIFLSLPGGPELETVAGALLAKARQGQTVVDLTTAPVGLTRELAAQAEAKGVAWADAPVARTRAAAEAGTLSATVGAREEVFARIEPLLRCFCSDVTHVGAVGAGQVAKLLNNMVLLATVVALSEALAVGRRAGVDGAKLFDALSKGSADSFALRNHGMKAMVPGDFPERAYSVDYARKDLGYALELARQVKLELSGAHTVEALFQRAAEAGLDKSYFPVIAKLVNPEH
jgi:3-hydroxyisobutyrate dehydrogenase-like beta-hydroxyacid dehydrogenase